jgi:hypothetical protein
LGAIAPENSARFVRVLHASRPPAGPSMLRHL